MSVAEHPGDGERAMRHGRRHDAESAPIGTRFGSAVGPEREASFALPFAAILRGNVQKSLSTLTP